MTFMRFVSGAALGISVSLSRTATSFQYQNLYLLLHDVRARYPRGMSKPGMKQVFRFLKFVNRRLQMVFGRSLGLLLHIIPPCSLNLIITFV